MDRVLSVKEYGANALAKISEREWEETSQNQGFPRLVYLWPYQCRSVCDGKRCMRRKDHLDLEFPLDLPQELHIFDLGVEDTLPFAWTSNNAT